MSSDLLKEFGSPDVDPWHGVASQNTANEAHADEDDFGDFEGPENKDNVTLRPSPSPHSNAVKNSVGSGWSRMQQTSADEGNSQSYNPSSTTEVQDAPSDDDDWGNFSQPSLMFDADVEAIRKEKKKEVDRMIVDQRRPNVSTSILLHPTAVTKAPTPASSIPATTGANGSKASQEIRKAPHESKDTSKRSFEATTVTDLEQPTIADEPWVDFDAAEAGTPTSKLSNAPSSRTFKASKTSNLGPPPSNIPPPSILLPVIATVLGSLATELKIVTSNQPLNQPNTISQLRTLLSTIRAAARILAGRKIRWKRDKHLSQSMKIGPAHSGKAGGMKLAGVDKAESRREDQEAAEALQVWKQQAGPIRSIISTLNSALPETERFKISEIADNMPIRQGKPGEGMVTAPKCCFLCGIKRDERLMKVDFDVEDSFGEWWVEHWGHVDCVAFWENHKYLLRQR